AARERANQALWTRTEPIRQGAPQRQTHGPRTGRIVVETGPGPPTEQTGQRPRAGVRLPVRRQAAIGDPMAEKRVGDGLAACTTVIADSAIRPDRPGIAHTLRVNGNRSG